jgi:putative spermidine/putrescine transport system ATP-binding protein
VSEIIYAGPVTRIAATAAPDVTLTATVLTANAALPELGHGTAVTFAWPDNAVHSLEA